MAFATANVQKNVFGSLKVTHGDWSGSLGDANGTITVEGGRVYQCSFTGQDSSGTYVSMPVGYSVSTTDALTTITIRNDCAVTVGRFLIIHS